MYFLEDNLPDTVGRPSDILAKLLRLPEFAHLRDGEASVRFIFREAPKIRQGRRVLGTCHIPSVQGQLKDVFTWMLQEKLGALPDFLIELESDYWLDEARAREREILVYHELCHAAQAVDKHGDPRFDLEGRPVWAIAGHDVEEFAAVVRRYGVHSTELRHFVEAAKEGEAANS